MLRNSGNRQTPFQSQPLLRQAPRKSNKRSFQIAAISRSAASLALAVWLAAPLAAGGGDPDFTVASIEINQALEHNSAPLVAGRSTMVRAVIHHTGAAVPVDGVMRVFQGGVELGFSPLYSDNGPILPTNTPDLELEDDSLNFIFIPPAGQNFICQVEVNPAGPNAAAESDTSNNLLDSESLVFRPRERAELVYVPIDYRPSGGAVPNLPDHELIKPSVGDGFVSGIYPVHDWDYHRSDAPSKLWTSSLSGTGVNLNNSLTADVQMMSPKPDFIYGWVPGGLPYNGQAILNGVASMGNTQPIRHQRTFAHELGHVFGLSHNSSMNGLIGVDVEHQLAVTENLPRIKPSNLFDIMVGGQLTESAWVRQANYNFFFGHQAFAPGVSPITAAPDADGSGGEEPVFFLAGVRNLESGVMQASHAVRIPNGLATVAMPESESDLVLRAYGESGLLRHLPFAARISSDCSVPSEAGEAGQDSAGENGNPVQGGFQVALSLRNLPEAVQRLELFDPRSKDGPSLELVRSAHAPEVQFLAPTAGEVHAGSVLVRWESSDADGDALQTYLRYSPFGEGPDGAERLVPISLEPGATEVELDLTQFPALVSGQGYFELIVSDGLNTTVERSSAISSSAFGGNAPWTYIMTPDDLSDYEHRANVILHGTSWDLEDRILKGDSLVWSSNLDGPIGTSRHLATDDLSLGTHIITLVATDSDGMSSQDSVMVTINDRPLPGSAIEICQTDLGFGGPGIAQLSICGGDLSSGTVFSVELVGAAPSTPAWILGGTNNSPTPLLGGSVVPVPAQILISAQTDAFGTMSFTNLGGGGGPVTLYFQVIYFDNGEVENFGMSNAVQADFLP